MLNAKVRETAGKMIHIEDRDADGRGPQIAVAFADEEFGEPPGAIFGPGDDGGAVGRLAARLDAQSIPFRPTLTPIWTISSAGN